MVLPKRDEMKILAHKNNGNKWHDCQYVKLQKELLLTSLYHLALETT